MVHPPPKRRKIEIVGGSVWGEKEVAIEPAKELFLYQDNKGLMRMDELLKAPTDSDIKIIVKQLNFKDPDYNM